MYSIVICVNDNNHFLRLIQSLDIEKDNFIEIIKIDNFDNRYSLPEALNIGINRARSQIVFLCHQDIKFPKNWIYNATEQISLVSKRDTNWSIIGVMGVKKNGFFVGNIVDPHTSFKMGNLPCEVSMLDEVCLVVKKESNLAFDESLGGYHLYGADLCMQSQQRGMKCYVINAPFTHLSGGKLDNNFWQSAKKLKNKWSMISGSENTIETTCGVLPLNDKAYTKFEYIFKSIRRKIIRRLQKRHIMK